MPSPHKAELRPNESIQTWDTDYARRNGDDEITWGPDAYLTPLGEEQSRVCPQYLHTSDICPSKPLARSQTLGRAWKANLAADCPRPEKWFLSPFTRTSDTMKLSFGEEVLQGASVTFVEVSAERRGVVDEVLMDVVRWWGVGVERDLWGADL